MKNIDIDKCNLVSMEDAMNAKYWAEKGEHVVAIYIDHYWLIYDGDKLLLNKKYGNCIANQNEKIVEHFKSHFAGEKLHIRKLNTVFIPWGD